MFICRTYVKCKSSFYKGWEGTHPRCPTNSSQIPHPRPRSCLLFSFLSLLFVSCLPFESCLLKNKNTCKENGPEKTFIAVAEEKKRDSGRRLRRNACNSRNAKITTRHVRAIVVDSCWLGNAMTDKQWLPNVSIFSEKTTKENGH